MLQESVRDVAGKDILSTVLAGNVEALLPSLELA